MSKLKVGDRVRTRVNYCGIPSGSHGTVVVVIGDDGVEVCVDGYANPENGGWVYDAHEVEPASSAPNAPPPNTVRVRIAVAVDAGGVWAAWGAYMALDDDAAGMASRDFEVGTERVSFITADIPLPEKPAEIQGVVE
jgi:hypothetical protein